ncbi:hypothetical protein QBC33DRAFT_104930 [Phialemonium atrogriseum]|uniref:Chitin synthase activator n=1 Tax=Phialemonium atrogriseum TaxID=1093897 RepID=A0AAJ0BY06_9PEZI|nr:uncharacterized protein QBC33DRAFT_104930 [Phialemonium atrogriseum]KAK1766569.1 hypothetical protein QBC33DRAFT_104930 [Phialemonium atrogriseum]
MPEVPQNMQEDLQRMELEANERGPHRDTLAAPSTNPSFPNSTTGGFQPYLKDKHDEPDRRLPDFGRSASGTSSPSTMDAPSFSPFPKVTGENIPPSDEEKEGILYQARATVLHSNNVSMQVAWARDALVSVEVAAEAQARDWKRENKGRDRQRPPTPKVEHELRVDAVNIIEYLAQQNHPEATFMKAKWQEFGKFGYRENKRDAYLGYKKAADLGWGRAEYRMGMLYENSNDTEKAIKHYSQGASMNDSASCYRLGMMHLMGQHGYQKDLQTGLEMVQKAADGADEDAPQGAYVYGMLVARDLPDINIPEFLLPIEVNVARQYIEKAAYLCFSKAQLKMGQAYELSQLGCDFKPAYSLHYYGLAARQGQPEAALGVSRWFLFGFEGVFSKNEQLAYRYAEEAAEAGLPTGEFAMGYYCEIGIHVQKDIRQARKWYELAAEHGNSDAKDRLESLNQSKTLTKKDHETTTLTRIKSQYGSQRGKRPARLAKQNETLPTLPETSQSSSAPDVSATPPRDASPGLSPKPSPRRAPVIFEDTVEFPDPERRDPAGSRPPAFTVNFGSPNLALRPKSAAPYPVDDRPPPLNLSRPKSTAPYPDDDVGQKPALSPHFNPSIRPSAGPHADRPGSAFGIRPLSSHSSQNLLPKLDYRGHVPTSHSAGTSWEPQVPAGYRQPSPGPARNDYPYGGQGGGGGGAQQQFAYEKPLPPQRLGAASVGPGISAPTGAIPVGDPTRNRLQKANPGPAPRPQQAPPMSPPGQFPMAGYGAQPGPGAQPGRDYGPRTTSRPVSDVYDHRYGGGGRLPPGNNGANVRPERLDSLGPMPGGGGGGGRPPLKDRPGQFDSGSSSGGSGPAGRASAPPGQRIPRPGSGSPSMPPAGGGQGAARPPVGGKANSAAAGLGVPAHPDGKTMGNGPATFEAMGIPQGKNENDCVVM